VAVAASNGATGAVPPGRDGARNPLVAPPDGAGRVLLSSLYREPEVAPQRLDWPALEVHDVFKIYPGGGDQTVALRGVELEVAPRSLVAILGPSGCGKSTLLLLAAGLDVPSAGDVRVFGRSLGLLDEQALAAYRATEIAVVFQSDNLWSSLTAEENVAAQLALARGGGRLGGARNRGRLGAAGEGDEWEDAARALAVFGLAGRRKHRARALSGGEVQRVAIAGAAARGARLVLADEPTGELDLSNERLVLDALLRLRDEFGSTVVVVTHSARVAEAADRVVEMRDGRIHQEWAS
jgi:putative ABC transport system ATP-binding protein